MKQNIHFLFEHKSRNNFITTQSKKCNSIIIKYLNQSGV